MDVKKQILVSVSNQASLWMILSIFVVGLFFSALIPPFQSPDESSHIKRAYLLSKGTIVLDAPEGKSSGGLIDSGLSSYIAAYTVLPFKPDRKLSADEIDSAKNIKWTGIKEFSPAPGTGYYFPIIYMPQAIGLVLGEKFGLTIDSSYQLARFMALASITVILLAAFNIYSVSPLTIALLIIPMSVFQFSSASLDGVSTALAIFSVAAFLRIVTDKESTNPWLFYALSLSVILLATSRVHLLPLLALVLVACFYTKENKYFFILTFSLLAVLAWLAVAIKTTVDTRVVTGASTSSIAFFYIRDPMAFVSVLLGTISDNGIVNFYRNSFFGILGWLDTPFSDKAYEVLWVCTLLIGILSVSVKNLKAEWIPRIVILLSALTSILLIFFALLITWTPHPASLIQGVQGRYFLVPMIMIAYAISGKLKLYEGVFRKIALLLTIFLGAFTFFSTPRLLIERYYLAHEQPEQIDVVMRASAPLNQNNPIAIVMSKSHESNLQPLKRLGIRFGTYRRKNPGRAELRLTTLDGHALTIPFDLPDLADNQYKYFELDSMPYSFGQIVYLTGGGVSTWEAHEEKGSIMTCLIFEYTNGMKRYTRGCPRS